MGKRQNDYFFLLFLLLFLLVVLLLLLAVLLLLRSLLNALFAFSVASFLISAPLFVSKYAFASIFPTLPSLSAVYVVVWRRFSEPCTCLSDSYVTDPSVLCVSLYLSAFGVVVPLGVAPSLVEVVVFSVVVAAFFTSSSSGSPPLVV